MGRVPVLLQTSQVFERFLAPGSLKREKRGCLYCIFNMRVNKRFGQVEENTVGNDSDGSFLKKNIPRAFLVDWTTLSSAQKSSIQEKTQISDCADRSNKMGVE